MGALGFVQGVRCDAAASCNAPGTGNYGGTGTLSQAVDHRLSQLRLLHHFRINGKICDNIDSYKPDSCYTHQWTPKTNSIDCNQHSFLLVELVLVSVVLVLVWACSLVEGLVCLLELVLVWSHMGISDLTKV